MVLYLYYIELFMSEQLIIINYARAGLCSAKTQKFSDDSVEAVSAETDIHSCPAIKMI